MGGWRKAPKVGRPSNEVQADKMEHWVKGWLKNPSYKGSMGPEVLLLPFQPFFQKS